MNRSLLDLLEEKEIKEDVVSKELNFQELILTPTSDIASNESTDHVHKMTYIQTIRGFKSVDQDHHQRVGVESSSSHDVQNGALSKTIQRVWICMSTLCHGFLGGVSITHLILIWTTSPEDWPLEFLKRYAAFAEVFGNTFYFLVTICMVSVLDR